LAFTQAVPDGIFARIAALRGVGMLSEGGFFREVLTTSVALELGE